MSKKETRGRKRGKYYVSDEELAREIQKFYNTGIFSEELGKMVKMIVDGLSNMPNFINYFKDNDPWGAEMYSDALWRITKAIHEKQCIIYDDEDLGDTCYDEKGRPLYKMNRKREYILDEDGEKVEKIKENKIFNYLTTVAGNAFIGRIKKEKKDVEKLKVYRDNVFQQFEEEFGIAHQNEGEFKGEGDY